MRIRNVELSEEYRHSQRAPFRTAGKLCAAQRRSVSHTLFYRSTFDFINENPGTKDQVFGLRGESLGNKKHNISFTFQLFGAASEQLATQEINYFVHFSTILSSFIIAARAKIVEK